MLFDALARTSRAVAETRARLAKLDLLADCLRTAGPDEVPLVVAYLSGELRQRRTGVGGAALRDLPAPVEDPTLQVLEVDAAVEQLAAVRGAGSAAQRRRLLHELFGRATADEQHLLGGLLAGELRQGALAGLMVEAVARAAAVPVGRSVRP